MRTVRRPDLDRNLVVDLRTEDDRVDALVLSTAPGAAPGALAKEDEALIVARAFGGAKLSVHLASVRGRG